MHAKLRPTASIDSSFHPSSLSPIPRVRAAPKSDVKYAILSIHDRLKRIITRVMDQVHSHPRPQAFDEVVTDLMETASRLETDLKFALTVPWADSHPSGSFEYQSISQALETAKSELLKAFRLGSDHHKVQAEVWEVFAWLNGKLFQEICRNKGENAEKEKLLGFVSRLHEDKQALNQRLMEQESEGKRLKAQLEASIRIREEAEALNRDLAQANDEVEERIRELRQDYSALKEELMGQFKPDSERNTLEIDNIRLENDLHEAKLALEAAEKEENTLLERVSSLTEDLNDLRTALGRAREELAEGKEENERLERDLDMWKESKKAERLKIEKIRGMRVEPDSAASTAQSQLQARISDLQSSLSSKSLQLSSLSSEFQALKSSHFAEIQAISSSLSSKIEENSQLKREMNGYEDAIPRLESAIAAAKERESAERMLRQEMEMRAGEGKREVERRVGEKEREISAIQRELGVEKGKRSELAEKLREKQEECSTLTQQYAALQGDYKTVSASLAHAISVEKQTKEDLNQAKSASERSISDLQTTINSFKSRESTLETAVSDLKITLESTETELKRIIQEKESELQKSQLLVSQKIAEIADFQRNLTRIQLECESLKAEKTNFEREIAAKEGKITAFRTEIGELQRENASDKEAIARLKAAESALVRDLEIAQLGTDSQVKDLRNTLERLESALKGKEEEGKLLNNKLKQALEAKERLENELKRKFLSISELEDQLKAANRQSALSISLYTQDCEASNRHLMSLEQDRARFLSLSLSLHSQLTTLLQSTQWEAASQVNHLKKEVERLEVLVKEKEIAAKRWEIQSAEYKETIEKLGEESHNLTETLQKQQIEIAKFEEKLQISKEESDGTITELREICAELTLKLDAERASKQAPAPARVSEDLFVLDSDPFSSDPQPSSRHVTGSLFVCKKVQYQGITWCLVSDYAESAEFMWVREGELSEGVEGGGEDEEGKMREMLGEMRGKLDEAREQLQNQEKLINDSLSIIHTAVPMDLSLDLPSSLHVLLAFLPNQSDFQPIPAHSLQPSDIEICNEDRSSSLQSSFIVESPALSDSHSDIGANPLPADEAYRLLTALKEYERENRRLETTSELQENQLKLLKEELKGKYGDKPVATHVLEAVITLARSLPDM